MSIAANQQRIVLQLLRQLSPHWRRDRNLPARIQAMLARRRRFGARDRRLYREIIFTALRHLPWIEPVLRDNPDEAIRLLAWLAAETPATHDFRAAFALGPPPADDSSGLLPAWLRSHCPEIFTEAELAAQRRRPPLWLRVQSGGRDAVTAELSARGWDWRPSEVLTDALAVLSDADVTTTSAWADGFIEVQDLGAQTILAGIGLEPGEHWLDYCAGAGGKTLQLSRLLGPAGAVDAIDVRPAALTELRQRAQRARAPVFDPAATEAASFPPGHLRRPVSDRGFAPITILRTPPCGSYDGVLADVPCSGSGTWRRAPHLKWTTTETTIARAAERQRSLLAAAAGLVRPGGRLVYATCSISARENEEVVDAFLADHPYFVPVPPSDRYGGIVRGAGRLLLPSMHDSDGYFVAALLRQAASQRRSLTFQSDAGSLPPNPPE